MSYIPKFNLIFVHIPKTAGHTVVNTLMGYGGWGGHNDLASHRAAMDPKCYREAHKLAFVRNPYVRLASEYHFQKTKENLTKRLYLEGDHENDTFEEWVYQALHDPGRYPPSTWGGRVSPGITRLSPQIDWVELDRRVPEDLFIGRVENIEEDLRTFNEEHLKQPPFKDVARLNASPPVDYKSFYTKELADQVYRFYRRDFEVFGYSRDLN